MGTLLAMTWGVLGMLSGLCMSIPDNTPLMEKALESMGPRPGASFSLGHVSLDQGNSQLHGRPLPTGRALLKRILLGPRFLSLS